MFFQNFPEITYDVFGNGVKYSIQDFTRYVNIDQDFLDDLSLYRIYDIPDGARPDVVSTILYNVPDYYWTFFLVNPSLLNGTRNWPMSSSQFHDYITKHYDGLELVIDSFFNGSNMKEGSAISSDSGGSGTIYKVNPQLRQVIVRNVDGNFGTGTVTVFQNGVPEVFNVESVRSWENGTFEYQDDNGRGYYKADFFGESLPTGGLTRKTFFQVEEDENQENSRIRVIKPELIFQFADRFQRTLNT